MIHYQPCTRNKNSVYFKVLNFISLDENNASKGMANSSKLDNLKTIMKILKYRQKL